MPKIYVIYDTRTGKTEIMAHAIVEGARSIAGIDVSIKKVDSADPGELSAASGIILGSPTHNTKPSYGMKNFMDKMKQLPLRGKVASAFGSYGWSGEAVAQMIAILKEMGITVIEPGLRFAGAIDETKKESCRQFGKSMAEKIKSV